MVKIHTSFIVCTVQRSGSFLLCDALKNTGLAGFPEEYFLYHPGGSNWEDGSWAIAAHNIEPLKVIYEALIEAYKKTGLRVLDFLGVAYPSDLVYSKDRKMKKQATKINEVWVEQYREMKQLKMMLMTYK